MDGEEEKKSKFKFQNKAQLSSFMMKKVDGEESKFKFWDKARLPVSIKLVGLIMIIISALMFISPPIVLSIILIVLAVAFFALIFYFEKPTKELGDKEEMLFKLLLIGWAVLLIITALVKIIT